MIALLLALDWSEILQALGDTVYMVAVSTILSGVIGIPCGILLFAAKNKKLLNSPHIYYIISSIVNILRAIPFIILLVLMMPVTNIIVGTTIGAIGVIPPLVIGAFPFVAKLVESSLNDLPEGIIDMAIASGATTWQIIWHVLLLEVRSSIVRSLTVTGVTLVAFSAMAGAVGGGGLGDLAIRYGYQRFDTTVMLVTVVIIILVVAVIQLVGDAIAKKLSFK